ncbi:MAG: oligosaccharide flippase family protein [Bacteroidota bacterium]
MAKSKLISDISFSAVQGIFNQLSGVLVFLIISRQLSKAELGNINWTLASLLLVFSALGFGLEQIAVRKTAAGNDPATLLRSYCFHVVVSGTAFLLILWVVLLILPVPRPMAWLLMGLAISQCFSFFAIPFRQIVNGLERFKPLFVMSSIGNTIKMVGLLVLTVMQVNITLRAIVMVYLSASFAEWILCIVVYRFVLKLPVAAGFDRRGYILLLKEALPQFGITVLNTAMQRMDWVLLGFLSGSVVVAEYSFTNKLFELSTLPLLVIGPVLLPRIVKLFGPAVSAAGAAEKIQAFIKAEMIIAVFVALTINLCWETVVDALTDHKYGQSTVGILLILSFAMPLLYLNNFLWSIHFAKEKMRVIFYCILFTIGTNIVADLCLIPFLGAKGAAAGFLVATLVQTLYYAYQTKFLTIQPFFFQAMVIVCYGTAAGLLANGLLQNFIVKEIIGSLVFFFLLIITGQMNSRDWTFFKRGTVV